MLPPVAFESNQLLLGTVCSGTDAPAHALQHCYPEVDVRLVVSCDCCPLSSSFIKSNFLGEHFYKDLGHLASSSAECTSCGQRCSAYLETELDLLVGGFPCKPFSVLSQRRWKGNLFKNRDARVFFKITQLLRTWPKKPKTFILENVLGLAKVPQGGCPQDAPLHFVLWGVDGKHEWGLKLLPDYHVTVHFQSASHFGLPHHRMRIWFTGVRRDIHTERMARRISSNFALIQSTPIKQAHLDNFINAQDDVPSVMPVKKKARKQHMPEASLALSARFRKQHGLPAYGDRKGHPFSNSLGSDFRAKFSCRELDLVDCAVLWANKKYQGDPPKLTIDVSQGLSRMPWTSGGRVRTMSTQTKLLHGDTLVNVKDRFRMMGWKVDKLVFPSLTESQFQQLLGNSMAVPTVGAVQMALLSAVFPA